MDVAQITFLGKADAGMQPSEVLAPNEAIVREGANAYVFVYENGRVRRQEVRVARPHGGDVVISEGLRSGQRIVIGDVSALGDGQEIEEE